MSMIIIIVTIDCHCHTNTSIFWNVFPYPPIQNNWPERKIIAEEYHFAMDSFTRVQQKRVPLEYLFSIECSQENDTSMCMPLGTSGWH